MLKINDLEKKKHFKNKLEKDQSQLMLTFKTCDNGHEVRTNP
jgi:hypothetical protein